MSIHRKKWMVWELTCLMVVWGVFFSSAGPAFSLGPAQNQANPRARDLGVTLGRYQPGPWNAMTDVPRVRVVHVTLIQGDGALIPGKGQVRTGVIIPRENVWKHKVPAGAYVLNGQGR